MKKLKTLLALTLLLLVINPSARSQVLISLLFGDKLNTGKIDFGLDGGLNWLNMSNTPNAKYLMDWNLGFYFDIKLQEKLFIHTGVLVKSKMGTSGLHPYPLATDALDTAFVGGSVDRKINYFNVPIELRYKIAGEFFVQGGVMLGLRYTADDVFTNTVVNKEDLNYMNDIRDSLTRIDAGVEAGLGYTIKNLAYGMVIHADYYYGLTDVNKVLDGTQNNSSIYLSVSIPIGKGKAMKAAAAKEKAGEESK